MAIDTPPADCEHTEFYRLGGQIAGRGAVTTGVVIECQGCGGLVFEERPKLSYDDVVDDGGEE